MSDRPQRQMPARGYPAIFPDRPASLEPEAWPEAKSGLRRTDLLITVEPRLVSDDQLRDPQIPRAPSLPRVHMPRARPVAAEQQRPADAPARTAVEAHREQATAPMPAAREPHASIPRRVADRWRSPIALLCLVGLAAATVALVAGLF